MKGKIISVILGCLFAGAVIWFWIESEAQEEALKRLKPVVEKIERDCPVCGWNARQKRSNDKPVKAFEGVFAPGTTCPLCKGKGKVVEEIDWAGGYYIAYGIGIPEERVKVADSKKRFAQEILLAKRAAQVEAARNALALAAKVRVHGRRHLDSPDFAEHITAQIRGVEYEDIECDTEAALPYVISKAKIPLWGVKGLTVRIFARYRDDYARGRNIGKRAEAPRKDRKEEVEIFIDARGKNCRPEIFPTVVDEKGNRVYDVASVCEEVALERGIAHFYSTEGEESLVEIAQEKPEKETKTLVVIAKEKGSFSEATVVVSEEDAKKMREADENSDSLKAGRVTIIIDRGL
jgi:hypothetical protein